jgi:Fe-S cluster biogenesis protein NfuA
MNNFEAQVREVLNKIRPYIQRDGGDLELDHVDEQGRVFVRVLGACIGCGAVDITYKDGVESLLMEEIPEVTEVVVLE